MNKPANVIFFVLVFLLQLIISNYLNLGPYVFICLVPFMIMNLPLQMRPQAVLLVAFGVGLLLDILSDGVAGLNAAAAVAAAAPRKFFYLTMVNSDRQDAIGIAVPGTVGVGKYLKYAAAVTAVYLAVYIALDCISFRPFSFILAKFAASTLANLALALVLGLSFQNRN